ncbi:hypothetical protein [Microbacterium sp. NPDC058345]|uniref:hypothetical protein n=1 Tax=Microbacterium sp. NPDC058345 TaxID=3346455 RepID=UPI003653B565
MSTTVSTASADLHKAQQSEGFEGDLGIAVATKLASIRKDLESFAEYQSKLAESVSLANQALQDTADGVEGLPSGELTQQQLNTIDMAAKTNSPVQVSPGVTMSPEQAGQWYADQAEAEREEAARKMAVALDNRIQEIIDGMPTSEYDPDKPDKEREDDDGPGGSPSVDDPRTGTGAPSVTGTRSDPGGRGEYDGPGVTGPDRNDPPRHWDPHLPDPRDPEVYPPKLPDPDDPDVPRIDGGIDGVVPGQPPGGGLNPPGGGLTPPGGGVVPPGGGAAAPGGVGLVGGAGVAGRVGGAGLAGGMARLGGVGGLHGAGGVAGGGSGVTAAGVAQGGAGARGGVMAGGGMAGGAGGAGGKKNRRRGQDLLAYELDDEDEGVTPDLGEAGAAGRAASDGREEVGW